jgi:RNA recognition motif-containing protein
VTSCTVEIRGLPPRWDKHDLAAFVARCAPVTESFVAPRPGQHGRYGFVEMTTHEAARRVVEALHGVVVEGRVLTVRPTGDRSIPTQRHGRGAR